ncbi:MAG TPA: glycosyltransferase family 4 protein [Puia sp.]|nr:glycosyltransferase family 4 protein [Puia sp.]
MEKGKKIRVLEGIRQGKIGGGESYLLGLVEHLDRSRYEPVVLSFTDGPMVERLKAQGISTHVIHTEKPFDVCVWRKVRDLIRDQEIDIVHAHGTRANSNLFWAAQKLKLPIMYTCHAWSFHPDQNPLVRKFRIWSENFLTSRMNFNICGSKANRDTGKDLFKNFDALVINNSIDPEKFNPYKKYKDIRQELGIEAEELVIVSVARFTLQKQPLKLISAFAEVCKKIKNVKLLMVGEGEQREKAIGLIRSLGLEDRVILQPFRQDVPDILAASDIFVLPSLWEAFPIALLEAMSMGKAVIGTDVDGTPEIIEDGENGILIGTESMEKSLGEAMISLCENAALRERLQQNAIRSIYNKYNVETLARRNEEVYEQLAHAAG